MVAVELSEDAHEEKAEVDGRSGVRVGLARALSAHMEEAKRGPPPELTLTFTH